MASDPQVERLRAELERLQLATRGGAGAERFAELLGLFLGNVPDFIGLLALDGTFLFLNRARPGRTLAEVLGRNLFSYLPEPSASEVRAAFARVTATSDTVSIQYKAKWSDGSEHVMAAHLCPVRNDRGVAAIAMIATDVTEQRRAETALRVSTEKLRIAVAATGMGLWSWDIKQNAVHWDDALCRMWGVTSETAPQTRESYLALIHPEDRERVRLAVEAVVRTGAHPVLEHRIVRPDGPVRRVLAKGTVSFAADGSPEHIVGGVLDITEQRELEERSRQAQKLEAIGQLSAGVAHNFNNMLMAILPNIELALRNVPEETAPLLRSAHEAGLRAAELVRQLMTFAGRAHAYEKRPSDVRELVERTVAICRRAFDHGIELSVSCPSAPQPVLADATQLEQALLNLLINARDALSDAPVNPKQVTVEVASVTITPEDGAVLGLDAADRYVCIRVIDNGVGMSPETRNRIYEPFFTTKEIGRGTGLGLSTARAIVQEHGGALECSSREGHGTTFTMYLPVSLSASVERAPRVAVTDRPASQTVLVVDDEASVRTVVRKMLERAGYTVHVAASGREALDLLADRALRESVSLVLLDLSMPGMSGDAVHRELRTLAPGLKVVYFSGHPLDVGNDAAGVIQKPATYDELVQSVRAILEDRS